MSVPHNLQKYFHGLCGAMVSILLSGTHLVPSHKNLGAQQGTHLDHCYFNLLSTDWLLQLPECPELLYNMWYLDDGVIAGPRVAMLHALSIVHTLWTTSRAFHQHN